MGVSAVLISVSTCPKSMAQISPETPQSVSLVRLVALCEAFDGRSVMTTGALGTDEHGVPVICILPDFLYFEWGNCFRIETTRPADTETETEAATESSPDLTAFLRTTQKASLLGTIECRKPEETLDVFAGTVKDIRYVTNLETGFAWVAEDSASSRAP